MQIIFDLTPEQEAALKFIARKGNRAATATTPEVIVDPEQYFRARVTEVLASYAEQAQREETQVIAEAFKAAPEGDRIAVLAALKISPAAEVKTIIE